MLHNRIGGRSDLKKQAKFMYIYRHLLPTRGMYINKGYGRLADILVNNGLKLTVVWLKLTVIWLKLTVIWLKLTVVWLKKTIPYWIIYQIKTRHLFGP